MVCRLAAIMYAKPNIRGNTIMPRMQHTAARPFEEKAGLEKRSRPPARLS